MPDGFRSGAKKKGLLTMVQADGGMLNCSQGGEVAGRGRIGVKTAPTAPNHSLIDVSVPLKDEGRTLERRTDKMG